MCIFMCVGTCIYAWGWRPEDNLACYSSDILSFSLSLFPLSLLHFFEAEFITGLELKQNRLASQGSLPLQNQDYKPEPLFPFF